MITTYPQTGSQNIGDQLITNSLISLIRETSEFEHEIVTIWREQEYTNEVAEIIASSDAIIFACLAIRPNFSKKEYPFVDKLIDANKPMYIVSSGTALDVSSLSDMDDYLVDESEKTLIALSNSAIHFGVRGSLSYNYLNKIGAKNLSFTGDVAFYDKNFEYVEFDTLTEVKKIVVSDPHRGIAYKNAFSQLITELKILFPEASIVVALHGKNDIIYKLSSDMGLQVDFIYKNKNEGLSVYDDADLHVGFRVHAHVSMLKRRKISYLLEQDGRGCDYGISLPIKISVPCYQEYMKNLSLGLLCDLAKYRNKHVFKQASVNNVRILTSMISTDRNDGFKKFRGLESTLDGFIEAIKKGLKGILFVKRDS